MMNNKQKCLMCHGTGKIDQMNDYSVKYDPCVACGGKGFV
jgi:DnaJ-class molecular chaperone